MPIGIGFSSFLQGIVTFSLTIFTGRFWLGFNIIFASHENK